MATMEFKNQPQKSWSRLISPEVYPERLELLLAVRSDVCYPLHHRALSENEQLESNSQLSLVNRITNEME